MGTWSFQYDALNRLVSASNYAVSPVSQQFGANYAGQNLWQPNRKTELSLWKKTVRM
jgi:hypothetical protein